MNYEVLKQSIAEVIRTNGNEEITGEVLQYILIEMVNSLGEGFQFGGVATPSTEIVTSDERIFWLLPSGEYSNFGSPFVIEENAFGVMIYKGSFELAKIPVGRLVDNSLTQGGTNPVEGGIIYDALNEKVDKEEGKGLSEQNFTESEKQKLGDLPTASTLEGMLARKQDVLTIDDVPTEDSTNPVSSGGVYDANAAMQRAIEAILLLIPSAATALNQLADKAFVNSSIATNTATFRGTYNLVSDLHLTVSASHQDIANALLSKISTADNEDYAFVQVPTSDTSSDIRVTERYKFNGTIWQYEYDLNNSGFTSQQWEAINSTITLDLVQKLSSLPTAAELAILFNEKQNTLTFDNVPMAGSSNPVKSGGLYELFAAISAMTPSNADANNKLVAEDRLALLDGRVSVNENDIADLQEAYAALTQSDIVVVNGALPSSGQQQNIIYRQPDPDHTPPQFYSDYMWNGTTWVLMATYNNAIDPRPKKGSQNLVTSGGVFDNMGALDVSELNATENPHTLATYADLSAAIAAIPSDYQKGGMIIKYVQTSDNKYVQFRYMGTETTGTPNPFLDTTNWQGVDSEPAPMSKNLVESGGVAEKIGQYTYYEPLAIVEGYTINGENGQRVIHEGANYANFAVNGGSKYMVLLDGNVPTNTLRISFFNSYVADSNTFISGTNAQSPEDYITTPNTAKLMRIGVNSKRFDSYNLAYEKSLGGKVIEIDNVIVKTIGETQTLQSIEVLSPSVIRSTGNLANNVTSEYNTAKYSISDYVGYDVMLKAGMSGSGIYAYTIMDENGTPIIWADNGTLTQTKFVVRIPTGAVYLYVQNPAYNPFAVNPEGLLPYRIDKLDAIVDGLTKTSNTYGKVIGGNIVKEALEVTSGCGVKTNGQIRTNLSSSYNVSKFDISDIIGYFATLKTKVSNSTLLAYSIHDVDGNVLLKAESVSTVKQNFYCFIPENAKYLYVANIDYAYFCTKGDLFDYIEKLSNSNTEQIAALNSILFSDTPAERSIGDGELLDGYHYVNSYGNISNSNSSWVVRKYDIEGLLSGSIHLYSNASEHNSVYAYSIQDANGLVLSHADVNVGSQREFTVNLNNLNGYKYLYITTPTYANIISIGEMLIIKDILAPLKTDMADCVTKVFTSNNNILWLGTSIPEGSTYPKEAAKKCGYNCINMAYGSSRLRWSGQRPDEVSSSSGKSLTATVEELEAMFRQDVTAGTITEATLEAWKNHSYERAVLPYINGTNDTQVSMIVLDHGYNDRGVIHTEMQDVENIDWTSKDRSTFVGAFNYLLEKIQEVNPFIKIVISGYFQNTVEQSPTQHSADICNMQMLIAEHYNLSIMKAWEHTQIGNTYVAGTNNYISDFNTEYGTSYEKVAPDANGNIMSMQLYCPDFIHPHSDKTGNCNRRLNAVYSKLLRDLI